MKIIFIVELKHQIKNAGENKKPTPLVLKKLRKTPSLISCELQQFGFSWMRNERYLVLQELPQARPPNPPAFAK